jgi:hypothetical protein
MLTSAVVAQEQIVPAARTAGSNTKKGFMVVFNFSLS